MNLPKKLKLIREVNNLTQTEFANSIGLSKTMWERLPKYSHRNILKKFKNIIICKYIPYYVSNLILLCLL